ncbi:MAG TPA: hypothetical protein VNC18_22015 [Gemmatimonadaceae bacterium]|jgi:hypothetical protein|nr:hypothetical protein [Gemmatimonadaceae bacterium]
MRIRRSAVVCVTVALIGAGTQGCYEYVSVESPSAPVGAQVELKISDPGRVGLMPRFGPGLDLIEGRLVAEGDSELTLRVASVTNLDGEHMRWSGESVNLNRGFVRSVKSRRLSPVRTAVLAAAAGAVLYVTAVKGLVGSGKDPPDTPDPANPPLSRRIPVGFRIHVVP